MIQNPNYLRTCELALKLGPGPPTQVVIVVIIWFIQSTCNGALCLYINSVWSGQKAGKKEVEAAKTTDIKSNHEDLTFAHLLNEKRSELLFFQLPDHLPSRRAAAVKAEDSSKSDSKVTLNLLSEGYLGKLQLRKSGKVQLWINDVLFDVDIGTQVGFLQELYSVDTNGSHGNMTNLGRVRNRVITMPAWQELFAATAASTMEEEASSSDDDDIVS